MSGHCRRRRAARSAHRRRRRQRARITFVAVRRQPHRRPDGHAPGSRRAKAQRRPRSLDGLLQAGRAPTRRDSRRPRRGGEAAEGRELLDGDARRRRDARGAQPQPLGRRGVLRDDGAASSTGSLLLDGLGSGSDEQMRAGARRMLDALVLLLQSAATQYGVRAEVDAYVLPLVTLVQQAVLGPAGRAKTTARKRAATVAAAPPLALAARHRTRTTRRRPTALATATASLTSRRRSPPARGLGAAACTGGPR